MSALDDLRLRIFLMGLAIPLLLCLKGVSFVEFNLTKGKISFPESGEIKNISKQNHKSVVEHVNTCATGVIYESNLREKNPTNNQRPECTNEIFQTIMKHKGQYYAEGSWILGNRSRPNDMRGAHFAPKHCRLDSVTPDQLSICVLKNKLRKVLITGDSNAYNFFVAFVEVFKVATLKCDIIRQEAEATSRVMDVDYFFVPLFTKSRLQTFLPGCRYCKSTVYRCYTQTGGVNLTNHIDLEYIAMTHFVDSMMRMTFPPPGEYLERSKSCDSFIEYILRYYLLHHGYPDIWIMYPPMHHEIWSKSFQRFKSDLLYFRNLLSEYLPESTIIYALTAHGECASQRPDVLNWMLKHRWDSQMTRNEKILAFNQILFDVFRDEFMKQSGQFRGYLDLGKLSCVVTCHWHRDGAHMIGYWHQLISGNLINTICIDQMEI